MDVIFEVNVPTNKGFFVPNGRAGKMNFGILKEETINIPVFTKQGTKEGKEQTKKNKTKEKVN